MTDHQQTQTKAAELAKQAAQVRRKRLQAESDFQTALHKFDAKLSRLLNRLEQLASGVDADVSIEPTKRSVFMRQLVELAEEEAAILERCDEELSSVQRRRKQVEQVTGDKTNGSK